jgi:hypothetical protein
MGRRRRRGVGRGRMVELLKITLVFFFLSFNPSIEGNLAA